MAFADDVDLGMAGGNIKPPYHPRWRALCSVTIARNRLPFLQKEC
jgi:hypothetical protein